MAALGEFHPFKSAEARDRYLAAYDDVAKSWPVPSETRVVETPEASTFMRISGPDDAPPLFLLPAMGVNSLMWTGVIERLSERFRTFAIDDPYGGGRSINRTVPASVQEGPMRWLDGLFDAMQIDRVNLMGLSLGGYFTAEYVLHAPGRVDKAVWLAPPATVLPISRQAKRGLAKMAPLALIPTRASMMRLLQAGMPDVARLEGRAKEEFDDLIGLSMIAMRSFGKRPWGCGGPRVLTDEDLAGIGVPVLYLVGEHESFCDAKEAVARLHEVAPCVEAGIITGGGHDLVWTQPVAVSGRVLEFLGS